MRVSKIEHGGRAVVPLKKVSGDRRTFEIIEQLFLCVLLCVGERVCEGVEVERLHEREGPGQRPLGRLLMLNATLNLA